MIAALLLTCFVLFAVELPMATIYFLLCVMNLGLALVGRREVQGFLAIHTTIADAASLEAFKSIARRNMRFAICIIALFIPSLVVGFYLISLYSIHGLVVILVANALLIILARSTKKLEVRARTLSCTDETLRSEYHHVSETWTKKLLPDF